MGIHFEKCEACYESIKDRIPFIPRVALVLEITQMIFRWRLRSLIRKFRDFLFPQYPVMPENLSLVMWGRFRWYA